VLGKKNPQSFKKVMEICYIHMFIYTEFEIMNMLLKELRSKYKSANDLSYSHIFRAASERTLTEKTFLFF